MAPVEAPPHSWPERTDSHIKSITYSTHKLKTLKRLIPAGSGAAFSCCAGGMYTSDTDSTDSPETHKHQLTLCLRSSAAKNYLLEVSPEILSQYFNI